MLSLLRTRRVMLVWTFSMPKWTNSPHSPSTVAILIFDQFSNLCLANCLEPLQAANVVERSEAFDIKIVTIDGAPVHSSSGLQVVPHAALGEVPSFDTLFIVASYDHKRFDTGANRRALVAASKRARVTVGLDAAPWLLAAAGLLDGRQVTLHWDLIDAFSERFLAVDTVSSNIVCDGPFITCTGALAAMDLSLDLIQHFLGVSTRMSVEMLYTRNDQFASVWPTNLADPTVNQALTLMRNNLEHPLSLGALAQSLSCQPRTLDRKFRSQLGAPPGKVYRHLRLNAARSMVENRALSIAEISVRCGYESPAALARAFRNAHGSTPSQLRSEKRRL